MSRRTHGMSAQPPPFRLRGLTRYGGPFQRPSARMAVSHCVGGIPTSPDPVQPRRRDGGTLGTPTVWACTVSLAATPAPSYFLRVHEMFQFPGLPPPPLCVHGGVTWLTTRSGSPIRRSSRLNACARLPEAFRCYATSFFGTNDLGIHPTPSLTVTHTTRSRGVAPVALGPCQPHTHPLAISHPRTPRKARAALLRSLLAPVPGHPQRCSLRVGKVPPRKPVSIVCSRIVKRREQGSLSLWAHCMMPGRNGRVT